MIALVVIGTFFATLLGGFVALYLKDKRHLILGFSAGAVLGVAFFDLLPEALELAKSYTATTVLSITMIGFGTYLLLDRFIFLHRHGDEESMHRGHAGAGSLSLHSFLDGVGIGLAFRVAPSVGVVVAAAVLTHDFSDGINTVSLVARHGGSRREALRWLLLDALAPAIGVVVTLFFSLPSEKLGLLLALFAGFFFYIGASDLIPESYHSHPVRLTTVATLLGIATLYFVIKLAGG